MKITYRFSRSYLLLTSLAVYFSLLAGILETRAEDAEKKRVSGDTVSQSEAATTSTAPSSDASNKEDGGSTVKGSAPAGSGPGSAPAETATGSGAAGGAESAQAESAGNGSGAGSNSPSAQPAGAETKAAKSKSASDESDDEEREYGNVILKPGQKLKVEGFAEKRKAAIIDGVLANEKATYHRIQMRLTGSMCYACLKEFQEKLMQIYGVERARVEKSETPSIQLYSPEVGNYADGIIYIDTSRIDVMDLRAYIRVLGYHSYKVLDREAASVPPEGQKKI